MADNSSLLLVGADHRTGIQLVFVMFLLAKARAAVHSSLQRGASPRVTSIITAERSTGSDSSRVKTVR